MKPAKAAKTANALEVKDAPSAAYVARVDESAMVRTQIYLTQAEHHFLQAEAQRRKEPMAAVIRSLVDEKMATPAVAWDDNPMLRPTPKDAAFDLPEDAAINCDHYLYGTPKKFNKVKGQWVRNEEARG